MVRQKREKKTTEDRFAVVHWPETDEYSTIPQNTIVSDDPAIDASTMLNSIVVVNWAGKNSSAILIYLGTKEGCTAEEDILAREAMDRSFAEKGDPPIAAREMYAIVQWKKDEKYSIISAGRLINVNEEADFEDLIGSTVLAKYKSKAILEAVLKHTGTKPEMTEKILEYDTSKVRKRKNTNTGKASAEDDDFLQQKVAKVNQTIEDCDKDKIIQELRTKVNFQDIELTLTKEALHAEKKLTKRLKKKIRLAEADALENDTYLVEGLVPVIKAEYRAAKLLHRGSPSRFIRALIFKGNAFTLEELGRSSLTGAKPCNVYEQLPGLDPAKLDALKAHTIKMCNVKERSVAMMKFQDSLKNICTDARRKLNRQRLKNGPTNV